MQRPRIGIPLCLDDRERWRPGREYLYIDRRYAEAIAAAGGLPLHVPIQPDPEPVVAGLDGLMIPGGDDFPSERPLPPGVELDLVPDAQLRFDTALLEAARSAGLPVLGLCYGMQLLAWTAGGELEPHLPSARPGAERPFGAPPLPEREPPFAAPPLPARERPFGEHRLPETEHHPIEVEPGGRLAEAIGAGAKRVNSLHHQAVRAPGPTHRVAARSQDGVIEAIELAGAGETRWEIGVQWHPEKQPGAMSDALFGAFVAAARAYARTRRTR
jgi:putative glutamine amidotransferase